LRRELPYHLLGSVRLKDGVVQFTAGVAPKRGYSRRLIRTCQVLFYLRFDGSERDVYLTTKHW
jgi:hypothetical protein